MAGSLFQGATQLPGVLGEAFGGAHDPRLSVEQNNAARKAALLQGGLTTMMAASRTQDPMAALAAGAMQGNQVGAQGREQAYMATQEQRIAQALQNPQVLERLSPQQRAIVQMLPPMEAVKYLQEMLAPQEPKVVSEGAALVGSDGRPLYTNERQRDPWDGWDSNMVAAAMGMGIMDPSTITPDQMPAIFNKAGEYRRTGATNVNVTNTPEGRTNQGIVDYAISDFTGIREAANTARSQLDSLAVMDSLLGQGMTSGRLDDLTSNWRGIGAQLGIADAENLGRQELFRGISNRMALEMKEGMTGPMSDRDIMFLQAQVPQLANTPQGNRILLEVLRRMATRKLEMARLATDYAARTGVLDHGWLQYKDEWLASNPMDFSDLRSQAQSAIAPWER